MDRKKVLALENILKTKIQSTRKLKGGSGGIVELIEGIDVKYVYKYDSMNLISVQSLFYKQYANLPYLPRLLYESPDNTELIISYCEPVKTKDCNKIKILIDLIKHFIWKYSLIDQHEFGFMSEFITGTTFSEFLCKQAIEASHFLDGILTESDLDEIIDLIGTVYRNDQFTHKYLIHGDFGFHNFFHTKEQVTGIIDPDPIIGHPMYDLLFAFCSTPRDVTVANLKILLEELSKTFPLDIKNAKNYLKIALYKRISSCKKHHPDDLPEYLKIWQQLR